MPSILFFAAISAALSASKFESDVNFLNFIIFKFNITNIIFKTLGFWGFGVIMIALKNVFRYLALFYIVRASKIILQDIKRHHILLNNGNNC